MKLLQFYTICDNIIKLLEFLRSFNVINNNFKCPKCNSVMVFNEHKNLFRCRKQYSELNNNNKPVTINCDTSVSPFKDSWFTKMKFSIQKACKLIATCLCIQSPRNSFAQKEFNLSKPTIVKCYKKVRSVIEMWWIKGKTRKIGGHNKIIEVDEAVFGFRKMFRGRRSRNLWVVGGVERGSSKAFLVVIPNRKRDTLVNVIKRYVRKGSIIITDCWRGYHRLEAEGYRHKKVNHSKNFVNPDDGSYTQNVERMWRDVREWLPRYGYRTKSLQSYLYFYLFHREIEYDDLIPTFFTIIGKASPFNNQK